MWPSLHQHSRNQVTFGNQYVSGHCQTRVVILLSFGSYEIVREAFRRDMLWFENGFDEAFDLWFSCLNQWEPLCIKRKTFCINIFCVSFVIDHLCLIYKKNPHCGLNCYGKQSTSSKLTSYNTDLQDINVLQIVLDCKIHDYCQKATMVLLLEEHVSIW